MSHCTVVDWNNYMQEVLRTITISQNQQIQIGGSGKVVSASSGSRDNRKVPSIHNIVILLYLIH